MPVSYATLRRLIRPLPVDEDSDYACPECGYDVKQTLRDRFERCPECGTAINTRNTRPKAWEDRRGATALMFGVAFLPTLGVLASNLVPATQRIGGTGFSTGLHAPIALALTYPVVLFSFRLMRQRMGESPSWMDSALDAGAVLLLNGAIILVALIFV